MIPLALQMPQADAHGAYHDLIASIAVELEKSPDNAELVFRRVEINLDHQEWMLALLDLQKVETLAPGKFPTHWLKGRALDLGGKTGHAKTELDEFIRLNPGHDGALASRGRVLRKLGMDREALADFREVLSINPDAEPALAIEIADTMVASGAVGDADKLLDSRLARFGENTTLLLKSLEIEIIAGRWDAALIRAGSLEKSAPRPEPWMAKRAEILAMADRPAESRAAWTELREHLAALPNLERGNPILLQLAGSADQALAKLSESP